MRINDKKGSLSWTNNTQLKNKSLTRTFIKYKKKRIFKLFDKIKLRIKPGSLSWPIALALRARVLHGHVGSKFLYEIPAPGVQ